MNWHFVFFTGADSIRTRHTTEVARSTEIVKADGVQPICSGKSFSYLKPNYYTKKLINQIPRSMLYLSKKNYITYYCLLVHVFINISSNLIKKTNGNVSSLIGL